MTQLKDKIEEKQNSANKMLNEARGKLQEKQTEANHVLADAKDTLEKSQTVANGRLTQAKGLAKEVWGQVTNNDSLRRAGKKEQTKGYLQATYGNNWLVRNKTTVVALTAAAAAFLTYFFSRKNAATS